MASSAQGSTPSPGSKLPGSGSGSGPLSVLQPLRALAGRTDAFLAHLQRAMATPAGIDTVLLLVCYTSRLAASALSPGSILPVIPKHPALSARAAALAVRLRALSALLSDARMFLRLWALLGLYAWAKRSLARLAALASSSAAHSSSSGAAAAGGSSASHAEKRRTLGRHPSGTGSAVGAPAAAATAGGGGAVDALVDLIQLSSCIIFQSLENWGYLASKSVVPLPRGSTVMSMYTWSARFWAVFVGTELGRLAAHGLLGPAATRVVARKPGEETDAAWRRKTLRMAAWMPLTLHWSVVGGVGVPEWAVGALASIPGVVQMGELWAQTA